MILSELIDRLSEIYENQGDMELSPYIEYHGMHIDCYIEGLYVDERFDKKILDILIESKDPEEFS
jgi:hypothetical protein